MTTNANEPEADAPAQSEPYAVFEDAGTVSVNSADQMTIYITKDTRKAKAFNLEKGCTIRMKTMSDGELRIKRVADSAGA